MKSNALVVDESTFPALGLARSSRTARRLAFCLVGLLLIGIVGVLFAPWQQSVSGKGNVVAYAPAQRQQTVEAPIKGRITRWNPSVVYDGARVEQGQDVLEIRDLDPDFLLRLEEQRAALQRELEANRSIESAYDEQVQAFQTVRVELVEAADNYIEIANQKQEASEKKLDADTAAEEQAKFDYDRQVTLFNEGLASQLTMQLAQRKWKEALAKQQESQANLLAAKEEVEAKGNEREAKDRESQAKVNSAMALLRKAQADVAKTLKTISEMDVKIAQQQSQIVKAPQTGFILKMMVNQEGEMVKEGDPLFVLVPETNDRAVEIWVSGNDAPLITPGRHVRLQFEGWPAIQFAGWPSVAVGSFGGEVVSVDATDDGRGQFRVLVLPDRSDSPWPAKRFLKQGVRANGWVLLNQVGLGYELWRRVNGFPPVVSLDEPARKEANSAVKVPKLK